MVLQIAASFSWDLLQELDKDKKSDGIVIIRSNIVLSHFLLWILHRGCDSLEQKFIKRDTNRNKTHKGQNYRNFSSRFSRLATCNCSEPLLRSTPLSSFICIVYLLVLGCCIVLNHKKMIFIMKLDCSLEFHS